MSERLEYLARRAAADPFYLAAPLAVYARSEGLDDAALATRLGCSPATLTLLRLCRRPRGEGFGADVARIAGRFGIDPLTLAEIVRRADVLAALRAGAEEGEKGALIAARDRSTGGNGVTINTETQRHREGTERKSDARGHGESGRMERGEEGARRITPIGGEPEEVGREEGESAEGGLEGRAAPKRDQGEPAG